MAYWHSDSLRGRSIIVTGAARGIGKGIAQALLERGASVLLVDINGPQLAETTEEFTSGGYPAAACVADLRDASDIARIVPNALANFGSVHGLVNNAIATTGPTPFVDLTTEDWSLVADVGARATFLLMQAAYPALISVGGGSIVNLGSSSGTQGAPLWAAYAGSKEAIRGVSKVAALEWGADGIRVNTICPFAESDGTRMLRDSVPEEYDKALAAVPMKRVGDVHKDVGALVAFLMGDDSTYITAQTIFVDGGSGSLR